MIQQRERATLLQLLGADADVRDALDEPLGVKSWPLPGATPRPVKARELGQPDWWEGDEDASDAFLSAMGVNLP